MARHGPARRGKARQGRAWPGKARQGNVDRHRDIGGGPLEIDT